MFLIVYKLQKNTWNIKQYSDIILFKSKKIDKKGISCKYE